MKIIEAVERLRGIGSCTSEEARQQANAEAMITGKSVLMEKKGRCFQRQRTVFDLKTKTQRTLFRLLH